MPTKEIETRTSSPAKQRNGDFTDQLIEPFSQLRNEVDRIFDSFPFRLQNLWSGRSARMIPALEMTETDKAYKVTAELAGIEPEEVEVTFEDGYLRISGERKEEREENERGYYLSERSYGSFERVVELPAASDDAKIKAKFKNGLLTVTVPKNDKAPNARRIEIEKA